MQPALKDHKTLWRLKNGILAKSKAHEPVQPDVDSVHITPATANK